MSEEMRNMGIVLGLGFATFARICASFCNTLKNSCNFANRFWFSSVNNRNSLVALCHTSTYVTKFFFVFAMKDRNSRKINKGRGC